MGRRRRRLQRLWHTARSMMTPMLPSDYCPLLYCANGTTNFMLSKMAVPSISTIRIADTRVYGLIEPNDKHHHCFQFLFSLHRRARAGIPMVLTDRTPLQQTEFSRLLQLPSSWHLFDGQMPWLSTTCCDRLLNYSRYSARGH